MRKSAFLLLTITLISAAGNAESYLFKMIKDKVVSYSCNPSLPIKVCKVVFINGQKNEFYYRNSGELERVSQEPSGKGVEYINLADSTEVGKDRYNYELAWTLKAISTEFFQEPSSFNSPAVVYGGNLPFIHIKHERIISEPNIDVGLLLMSATVRCPFEKSCMNDLKVNFSSVQKE